MKIFNHYLDQIVPSKVTLAHSPKKSMASGLKLDDKKDRKSLIMPKIEEVFCK